MEQRLKHSDWLPRYTWLKIGGHRTFTDSFVDDRTVPTTSVRFPGFREKEGCAEMTCNNKKEGKLREITHFCHLDASMETERGKK